MSGPDRAMVFAAGLGTRMAPLTDRVPKPLIKVAGKPLIDHALDLLREAGIDTIVANTHHLPEPLEAHLAARGVTAIREAVLLDTGGGLKNAMAVLGGGDVITMNSDAVWQGANPVAGLRAAWDPGRMDALLSLIHPEMAIGHTGPGDFHRADDGRLCRGPGLIFSGVQIIKTARLAEIDDEVFSLNRLWDVVAAEARLFGAVHDGRWCDVGRPESIRLAEALLDV